MRYLWRKYDMDGIPRLSETIEVYLIVPRKNGENNVGLLVQSRTASVG